MAFPPVPPAPPPWVTPPSTVPSKKDKRTAYRLEREFRSLEREKKVTSILNSGFRNELENILRGQLEGDRQPKKTRTLHRPVDNLPSSPDRSRSGPITTNVGEAIIPINDLRGINATKYTLAERQVRCKLAAVYRLADMYGWSQFIYNHITACAPDEDRSYFVNAFGLMYHEVTASNLVRVDIDGNILDPGSTQLGINRSGFALHSAIHSARRDVKCIIHVHTNAGIAVSSMNCGLLPISGEALSLGEVSYHDYKGELYDEDIDEWEEIGQDLGPHNKVLILRNHGVVAMGENIEEAFHIAHMLVKACEVQVAVLSVGLNNVLQTPQGVWSKSRMGVACVRGVGGAATGTIGRSSRRWHVGELEFEALMRMLDNKGYNTGYRYKGLGLLEPGVGTPTTNRRDREERIRRAISSDPWDFLEGKVARDQPLSKPRQQRNARRDQSWEFLDSGKGHRNTSSTTTPEAAGKNKPPSRDSMDTEQPPVTGNQQRKLTPLELAHITAERVAHSTGEAVKKLAMHGPRLRHSEGHFLPQAQAGNNENTSSKNTKTSTAHQPVSPNMGLSPIQLAHKTAEQVAESTGQAVKKLATSQHIHYNVTPHSLVRNQGTTNGHRSSNTHHRNHQNETDSDSSVSDTDYSTTDATSPSHSIQQHSSPAHYTLVHTSADVHYRDGSSPIERVTHTAEIVADSTSIAVEKLSKSLVENL